MMKSKKLSRKKKLRPLGAITSDLEPLYFEMILEHGMQDHEIIAHFLGWRQTHVLLTRESLETYEDGTHPILYYGHQDGLK